MGHDDVCLAFKKLPKRVKVRFPINVPEMDFQLEKVGLVPRFPPT